MISEEVPLAAIDFEDERFRISEDLNLVRMSASLRAVGLICPAILLAGATASGFTIVCGFRRLHGLRSIGVASAAARIVKPDDFNELELFLKAFWDNLSHRVLNPLEAARALFVLKTACSVDDDVLLKHFLPLLGLSPHRNVLQSYLRLHRLHPELRRLLCAGRLSLSSAERLAQAPGEIQAQISPLLGSIRLSVSLQREVLDLADDLAAIAHTTLGEVLNQPEIVSAAADARLSAFQKGERIHDFLYRRRNPRITRAREKFQSDRADLGLPGTVRLSADPFFESPRLRVEFDVTSARGFREAVAALEHSSRKASLDRLFEVT